MTLSGLRVQSILLRIAPTNKRVSANCNSEDYLENKTERARENLTPFLLSYERYVVSFLYSVSSDKKQTQALQES